jgi:superfamily II DNA or RNA helicase
MDHIKYRKVDLLPLSLSLSPIGCLSLYSDSNTLESLPESVAEKIQSFFSVSGPVGLLRLGLHHFDGGLPPSFSFWQQFSKIFITEICKTADLTQESPIPDLKFPKDEMDELIGAAPFARGIEYFNLETASFLWQGLKEALQSEVTSSNGSLSQYLSSFQGAWNSVGRVCFHLAENKSNSYYPFAFLATYTTGLSKSAHTQHMPLGRALEEYSDPSKQHLLLSLLLPVHRAAQKSLFIKELVDAGQIFKPLPWNGQEAYSFLKDIPHLESAGVMIRVPNWWNIQKPPRPTIKIKIGNKEIRQVGLNALLDFHVQFSLPNGETLTPQEFKKLLNNTKKLVQIKGQWIQLDHEKLSQVLSYWQSVEQKVKKEGLSFSEGLRFISGVSQLKESDALPEDITSWSTVIEGDWLSSTLARLRNPEETGQDHIHTFLKKSLRAILRPYQKRGVDWLWWLYHLGLGGCLADDMGLGKTIQLIGLFLLIKQHKKNHIPHLLVMPASLIGNWQGELNRFAPQLSLWVAHSVTHKNGQKPDLSKIDIVITTYGMVSRLSWLGQTQWDLVILDEAQAIKNPAAQQTRAIKSLNSRVRFVLTGTPIENRLLDLWSLFDFIAPGLLGTSRVFADYSKSKSEDTHHRTLFYGALRRLVSPYILRRLKSDKQIIMDLPDKTEIQTYCNLTKQQIGLYQQAVNELAAKLANQMDHISRRGLVMSYLLRFKQICNHPNQWLGHGHFSHDCSGKFLRLKELCEVIAEKQEKVLIFSQFREIIPALREFLGKIFNHDGLTLDGQTPIKERAKRVEQFQNDQGPSFFILSLKAGGVGLNLTAASHVIHFDRWWNPAVENQATDRAFRIGQKKNVLVHKFICRGTIEEKIDTLLHSKKLLSEQILEKNQEIALTELSDKELLDMVTLDIHQVFDDTQ